MTSRIRTIFIGAALAALVALVVGIYGFSGQQGKNEAATASPSGLSALAVGPMAGLLVKEPRPELPPTTFLDGSGAAKSLSDWKGRVALVNLWATWCGPCRKEMPSLAALQGELGSKDFEVVAISMDLKGQEASAAFLKETGADALALYTDSSGTLLNTLNAPGLPATILVDRKGREAARLVGPAEWNSPEVKALIKALLEEAP